VPLSGDLDYKALGREKKHPIKDLSLKVSRGRLT